MFGLGIPELSLILFLGLLFFGKDKLPELARSIGKSVQELKKGVIEDESEPKTKGKSEIKTAKKEK